MATRIRTPVVMLLALGACGDGAVRTNPPPVESRFERVERRRVSQPATQDVVGAGVMSASPTVASSAVVARLREARVEDLVRMLDTATGRLRRDAIYELVRRGPPEALIERLIALQSDDDAWIAAAHALACFREPVMRELRERRLELTLVDDEHETEAETEAREDRINDLEFALAEIRRLHPELDEREPSSAPPPPSPSIDTLRRWLASDRPDQRCSAATAAANRGAEAQELVPAIVAALTRDDVDDPDVIAEALRELGAEHPALLEVRGRIATASLEELDMWMETLGALGPIARDDVAALAPRLLTDGGEFDRVATFDALCVTEADPAPFREAVAASLGELAYDRSAAARLLAANPELAREMRGELVTALTEGEFSGGRCVVAALRAAGGLHGDEALRLLDTAPSFRVDRVLAVVGPDTARPGDEVALRLWGIVLGDEDDDVAEEAFDALVRAEAIDSRDVPRLMDAVEQRELGTYELAELCPSTPSALPRLLDLLERGHDVTWPIAMLGPRAAAAVPRLVLEARDQDCDAANALGAIGVVGVEPLRSVLDGQHDVLREEVLIEVLWGVREVAADRTDAQVDAACRGYLSILAGVDPEQLDPHLAPLTVHADADVRWAAERLR